MTQQLLADPASTAVAASGRDTAAPTVPVLHIINGEHYAGAERVQDLLGLRLPDFGYRPGFACLKPGQFAAMRRSGDLPLYSAAMKNRADLSPIGRLARIVRSEGYRIIHTHTARSAIVGCAVSWRTGVPMVHHVHSPTTCDTTHRFRNWMNCLAERLVLRRAKAIIAVSEAVGSYVRQQGFDAHVIPNGVPARPSVPPRGDCADLCGHYRASPGYPLAGGGGRRGRADGTVGFAAAPQNASRREWTLGVIALFRPRKGLEVLLEALAELRRRGLPVSLRAVGSFETLEYERKIGHLAAQLQLDPAIQWTGFVRDTDSEMARMDLFVLPSLFGEGLPMVVLEAMSAGLPVIASAVPGVPEAVRDGVEGLLVPPGQPMALADAIARFVSGEVSWHSVSAAAVQRHGERFSDARMAAEVARVYDGIVGGVAP